LVALSVLQDAAVFAVGALVVDEDAVVFEIFASDTSPEGHVTFPRFASQTLDAHPGAPQVKTWFVLFGHAYRFAHPSWISVPN
jgi:hypothetical protein